MLKYTPADAYKARLQVELARIEGDLLVVVRDCRFDFDQQWLCGEIRLHVSDGNSLNKFKAINTDAFLGKLAEFAEQYVRGKAKIAELKDRQNVKVLQKALDILQDIHEKLHYHIRFGNFTVSPVRSVK